MLKIIAIALTSAIIIIYLKNIRSDLTIFVEIMSVIILLYLGLDYLNNTFSFIHVLIEMSNVDKELFKIIFKATGIGYLVEFSAGIIEDFGLKSLSDKLILVGKIIILGVTMPIIYAVFNLVTGFI